MTVQEALALPSLCTAQVLAGRSGLERQITSAMIIEAADIENWGKKGQLLLTSYYAFQGMIDEDLSLFFEKLEHIGVSGLVLKVDRLLHTVPAVVVSLCDKASLPLIQIPGSIKYEGILLDVFGHILDSNLTLLNRFFEVHSQLTALALRHPSILQLLQFLRRTIRQESTFYGMDDGIKVSSTPSLSLFEHLELTPLTETERYRNYLYFHAALTYEGGRIDSALAVSVPSSDNSSYYLIIHDSAQALKPLDTMTIENVVSMLQMEILKQNAVEQKLFFRSNSIVNDLLNGRYNSKEKIDSTLHDLALSDHPLYQVLLFRLNFAEGVSAARREELLTQLRRRVKALYENVSYLQNNNRLTFIHNYAGPASSFQIPRLEALLKDLKSQRNPPEFHYLLGLSESQDRYCIINLNGQVLDIYKLFDNNGWDRDIAISYANLGVYKLFVDVDDPVVLLQLLDPRIRTLREKSPELLATLIAFCECNTSYQDAAKRLFLHYKTVHYRIDRIQKLWKLNPFDSEDLLQVLLGARILSLIGEHP